MGRFSWMYADDSERALQVYGDGFLLTPHGYIYERTYDGYGHFGGKDVFELVVSWNRKHIASNPDYVTHSGKAYKDYFWYDVVSDLSIPDNEIVEECRRRFLPPKEETPNFELRLIGINIACWGDDNSSLEYPIKILCSPPKKSFAEYPSSDSDPNQGRGFPSYYDVPTQVIFYDEELDEMHGGIAYMDEIICLECGGTFEISEIEIKEELPWKDIEEAAVGEHMSCYA